MMSWWIAAAVLLALLGGGGWWAARRDAGVPSGVDPRKSYFIAPFEIQSSDPKLAWLREASVSMLALNLSQWSDLNVVDYERSLDLLRDAKLDGARPIGLKDARALARKAGVWTIVMGQVQSTADSLLVTASLYDVASGRRVDQAVRSIPLAADPRSVYDAIARDLLDIAGAPALDFNLAKGTTSSVEAFRAYLVGLKELNSWHLAQADKSFAEAIHADTTFALAYYKRALARGWWTPNDTSAVALIQQAVDNSARLSTRERDIVTAYSDLVNALHLQLIDADPKVALDRYVSAQRRYLSIVQRDSLATEAWYGLGDAYYHAQPDQFGPLTAANHSLALRAFNRTLALDSTFHLAYSHKLAIYQSAAVDGSPWVLVNDTIYYVPAAQRVAFGLPRLAERKNAARALAISEARAWVESDPDAVQAHSALVGAYIAANRLDSAIITIENASKRRATRVPELLLTVPALRMRSDPIRALSDLRTALDEFPADSLAARGNPNRFFQVLNGANVALQVGSLRDLDRVKQTAVRAQPTLAGNSTAPIADWYALTAQAAMGVPVTAAVRRSIGAGFDALERLPAPYGALARSSSLSAPYVMALATRDSSYLVTLRKWAPEGAQFAELDALMALSRGDTAAAVRSVKLFPPDSLLKTADFSFGGMRALARAEVLTALGDTRRALTMYEALAPTRFVSASPVEPGWALYTRSFLARGRLYEELGEKAKAQQAYTRFIELWKDADPLLQSQSRAARDGLARLGDAPPTRPIGR
jgi:tetratricopeptide (TPR) repeat protein